MLEALCITEAEAAGLSELAALDLAMARDFAARAQAAEDLHQAVERVIWAEHEAAETEDDGLIDRHLDRLAERLDQQLRDPRFGLQPLDDHVAATCRDLG